MGSNGHYYHSIWSQQSGTLVLTAGENTRAGGLPAGAILKWPNSPKFNSQGLAIFSADLAGAGIDPYATGIFSGSNGSTSLLAREGDIAPGYSGNVRYRWIHEEEMAINAAGSVAFRAELGGANFFYGDSIWTNRSGSLQKVAAERDPAPDTNSSFALIQSPTIGANGSIAFRASIHTEGGTGVTEHDDSGIWSDRSGQLSLVAREGSLAPGMPSGVKFGHLFSWIDVADGIAFPARVSGTNVNKLNDDCIWSDGFGTLNLIAREGDQAPGFPTGVTFNEFTQIKLLRSRQLVLAASVRGFGLTPLNDNGLWAQDQFGVLQLIVREGDLLEVNEGDFRKITRLGANLGLGINDFGQVAFAAEFADGTSGVFVSNRFAIPEPESAYYTLFIAAAILGIRTRGGFRSQS
jgi:hypothetical protein